MSSQEGSDDGAVAVTQKHTLSCFDCAIFDIQQIHCDVQSGAIKKARENTDFPATFFRTPNTREKVFSVLKELRDVAVTNGELECLAYNYIERNQNKVRHHYYV